MLEESFTVGAVVASSSSPLTAKELADYYKENARVVSEGRQVREIERVGAVVFAISSPLTQVELNEYNIRRLSISEYQYAQDIRHVGAAFAIISSPLSPQELSIYESQQELEDNPISLGLLKALDRRKCC